jgi:serine/threonine protein kinase
LYLPPHSGETVIQLPKNGNEARPPKQKIQKQIIGNPKNHRTPQYRQIAFLLLLRRERSNPHIIQGTFLNLIMEYLPETLSKCIKHNYLNKELLQEKYVISYTKGLLSALKYLHVR